MMKLTSAQSRAIREQADKARTEAKDRAFSDYDAAMTLVRKRCAHDDMYTLADGRRFCSGCFADFGVAA